MKKNKTKSPASAPILQITCKHANVPINIPLVVVINCRGKKISKYDMAKLSQAVSDMAVPTIKRKIEAIDLERSYVARN